MLNSLYEEAVKKRGEIIEEIEKFDSLDVDIADYWNFEYIEPSNENYKIAAGDGSYSHRKFLAFNLYAVAAYAIIYDGDKLSEIENVELDTSEHHKFFTDKLRAKMSIFEIENAVKAINEYNTDYFLIDGSLFGDLIRPIPKDKDLHNLALENLENIFEFLKHKENIIAISKTSTSNDVFHSNYPDMSIFERLNKAEGYSNPIYKNLSSEMKFEFPIHNDFFRLFEFTIFYLRLDDYKNVLKVELPYRADKKKIEEIISIIKRDSIEGYPYLLKKAHNGVVIKNKNIGELATIIGLYEKSGREMLK
ncbi:DNA double-strand break repair nuclease NurA [Methanobrevibacter sp.]